MIKNDDFTRNYLNQIITPNERHSIDEWLGAFKRLSEIKRELKLDVPYHETESLKANLSTDELHVVQEAKRINSCAEIINNNCIMIIQTSAKDDFQYEDVSEMIRSAWWELISLFDYSPELQLSIYALCAFDSLSAVLEKTVRIVDEKLQ